ncbi:Y-family DNA polymerase [Candidatus Gracilibacteria bacterium]|nr:Y-family DNA polymerase [Candidatus Gracilibacteria bacterium]
MKHASVVALIDCNNFYASCEKVFDPTLTDRPVVILSNNDGCIIARSAEAKQLNIPMGAPYFKIKDQLRLHQVAVRSSNYALYGDLSERVMQTLEQFSLGVERYSIDEAFVDLSMVPADELDQYLQKIRSTVQQWTGIPVSIGVASTKTLAKIANHVAKKQPGGCCSFTTWSTTQLDQFLEQLPVESIWGIGRGLANQLKALDIMTAYQLKLLPLHRIRKLLSVLGERIVLELQGTACLPIEMMLKPKKGIMYTRGFGQLITTATAMEEAVASYTFRAWQKLHHQSSTASGLSLFMRTNRFSERTQYYSGSQFVAFPASADVQVLIKQALQLTRVMFKPGYAYQKAGIFLHGIESAQQYQQSLFEAAPESKAQHAQLQQAIAAINQRFGREKVRFAVQGASKPDWNMRQAYKSPSYTTNMLELPVVY